MSDSKAVIKSVDMNYTMQKDAVECATKALKDCVVEKDIAAYIKKAFDKKYSTTWHCIVGRSFGSYVTYESRHFIYFYLGQEAILLFKSVPPKKKDKKRKSSKNNDFIHSLIATSGKNSTRRSVFMPSKLK